MEMKAEMLIFVSLSHLFCVKPECFQSAAKIKGLAVPVLLEDVDTMLH